MAQATFSIRMDEDLKKDFDMLCNNFGMNATTAFNVFAKAVVREKRIPFEIKANDNTAMEAFAKLRNISKLNGNADMSLDEINTEIDLCRRGE